MFSGTLNIADHIWYRSIYENKNNQLTSESSSSSETKYDVAIPKEQLSSPNRRYTYRTLFTEHPRHTSVSKFLVHMVRLDGTLLFSVFDDYLKFAMYQRKFTVKARTFFETILGEKSQKPHFDIDIDITPENQYMDFDAIKDALIEQIIAVLDSYNIKIRLNRDIILCTSHREDKKSYHIIVNNYSHANNIEARYFYELVTRNIAPEYKKYIDSKVYSTLQQFRMLGSHKIGKENIKVFNEVWRYKDTIVKYIYPVQVESENHKNVLQLTASLVTTTNGCKILPFIAPDKSVRRYDDPNWTGITREEAERAIQMLADKNSISYKDPSFPFLLDDIDDHFVTLKRRSASSCRVCERIHEHENPYLFIVGNQKSVWFDCRRSSDNKKLFLGKLYPDNDPNYQDSFGVDKFVEHVSGILIGLGYENIDDYLVNIANELKIMRENVKKNKEQINDDEGTDEFTSIELSKSAFIPESHDVDSSKTVPFKMSSSKMSPKSPYHKGKYSGEYKGKYSGEYKNKYTGDYKGKYSGEYKTKNESNYIHKSTPYVPFNPYSSSESSSSPIVNDKQGIGDIPMLFLNSFSSPTDIENKESVKLSLDMKNIPLASTTEICPIPSTSSPSSVTNPTITHVPIIPPVPIIPVSLIVSTPPIPSVPPTPFRPTNLEPNYGSVGNNSSSSSFSINPFEELMMNASLSKVNGSSSSPSFSSGRKSTLKTRPKLVFDTESSFKFDQLDELDRMNSISISSMKQVPKKKPKSTTEQLGELYARSMGFSTNSSGNNNDNNNSYSPDNVTFVFN